MLRTLIVVAAAAFLTAPAPGQRTPLGTEVLTRLLQQYDKNKDGKIQKDEYPRTAVAFANLDHDGNGVLDAADFAAPAKRPAGDPRGREDADKLPKVGSMAPDFELPMLGMKDTTVKLSSLRGKQPVALIFGSWT